MEAVIPADHVFQRPTSIPPPLEAADEPADEPEPSDEPPDVPPPMSKSIYITCFSIVRW